MRRFFGLKEAQKFLEDCPDATPESINQAVHLAVDILGCKQTIGTDVARELQEREKAVTYVDVVVKTKKEEAGKLAKEVSELEVQKKEYQGQVTTLKRLAKLFNVNSE